MLRAIKDIMTDSDGAAKVYVAAVPAHKGKEALMARIFKLYNQYTYGGQDVLGKMDEARLAKLQDFYLKEGFFGPRRRSRNCIRTNSFNRRSRSDAVFKLASAWRGAGDARAKAGVAGSSELAGQSVSIARAATARELDQQISGDGPACSRGRPPCTARSPGVRRNRECICRNRHTTSLRHAPSASSLVNGMRRARVRADAAMGAEFVGPEYIRPIGNERQIRADRREAEIGA